MMFGLMIPAGYGVSADFLLELMINADMKGEEMPKLGKRKFDYTAAGKAAYKKAKAKKKKAK